MIEKWFIWIFALTLGVIDVVPASSQEAEDSLLRDKERTMLQLFRNLQKASSDAEKNRWNDSIQIIFQDILEHPESVDLHFDSISWLGHVESPDQQLRIFTWNIVTEDIRYKYFGYIQIMGKDKKAYHVYPLNDNCDLDNKSAQKVYTAGQWYGCLIYKILFNRFKGQDYYTLLALDYNDALSNKKLIDVLWFDEKGNPVFGKPIFKTDNGTVVNRVIFEYNAQAVMSVKWDERVHMIVCDHLSPIQSSMTGNYRFYGPDFSFDAYRFENGIWVYVPDINITN